MAIYRATPEDILEKIATESAKKHKGQLKIFFGYAAGVGKTYAMLEAAHEMQDKGIDVVAGYIEPHTRPETTELLQGLEALPTLEVENRGLLTKELDLDAAIARKPQLLLVDELAHTNGTGLRHLKRYQDIEELLTAGIDVYTTINVQHIESLNDIVAAITGVSVRERIPDYVFDNASQVELVDLEPEELITRLNQGKVYQQGHAQQALNNFFNLDNLVALREIALRRAADRVNRVAEKSKQSSENKAYREERILACLSPSPSNAKIIRTAARMATAFKGRFTALYVETPGSEGMSEESSKRLRGNLKLAQQLGAQIETVYGEDIAFQIAEFARFSGVSKIVLGRSNARRRFFFTKQPFSEQLTELAPNLDIYIIPDKHKAPYKGDKEKSAHFKYSLGDFIKSLLLLAAAIMIGLGFEALGFTETNIITIFILAALITSVITPNWRYSLLFSCINILTFNYLFAAPKYTFSVYDVGFPITCFIIFLTSFLVSTLASKIKLQSTRLARTAYRTKLLLETNQMLQQAKDQKEVVNSTAKQLMKLLNKTIIFYPTIEGEERTLDQPLVFCLDNNIDNQKVYLSDKEQAVAKWVFKNNTHAGATTNTLSASRCLYLAIRSTGGVYAVVGIAMDRDNLETFENNLVLSMLGECALALESELLSRQREASAMEAEKEKLRANLLRSISHDLRTPLTSISGNSAVLLNNGAALDDSKRQELYTYIYDDSMWLINLVENLLSVTKIEDGTMNINLHSELLEEVINEALQHIDRKSIEHQITVVANDEFILAKMEPRLIIQVIINIVNNAIAYTPKGSEIVISTTKSNGMAFIEIADNGNGIPDQDKAKLFDMFYTAGVPSADSHRGLGLGLALCKSIINAHEGEISVLDNRPQGTIFRFSLQAEEVTIND